MLNSFSLDSVSVCALVRRSLRLIRLPPLLRRRFAGGAVGAGLRGGVTGGRVGWSLPGLAMRGLRRWVLPCSSGRGPGAESERSGG